MFRCSFALYKIYKNNNLLHYCRRTVRLDQHPPPLAGTNLLASIEDHNLSIKNTTIDWSQQA